MFNNVVHCLTMNNSKKVFVGVRLPEDMLLGIRDCMSTDPEGDLSSFIRNAVRRELSSKYLKKVSEAKS